MYDGIADSIPPWYIGGYWTLPLSWLQNGLVLNEFTADRWNVPYAHNPNVTLGQATLAHYDFRQNRIWVWLSVAYTSAFIIGLNIITICALKVLPCAHNPPVLHVHVRAKPGISTCIHARAYMHLACPHKCICAELMRPLSLTPPLGLSCYHGQEPPAPSSTHPAGCG